ncbi:TonB-dependent receptor [Pseudoduganella sp. SL102]|uniref:TonB-dependent receptor n=1 Tax=Pseudoduganella sp. SL102 TaxID=2995154 RepID=UPI00248A981C|nr:TonB-dependent receptor [Pseudoduganella sp. SL102]WBS00695.1 TonB-dependent receptor [Pseudoduganella sp. SL102]
MPSYLSTRSGAGVAEYRCARGATRQRMTAIAFAATCLACGIPATALAQSAADASAAPVPPSEPAAAAAPQKIQEVVVTGSSIRGVGAVGSPALSLGRDAIAASGATNSSDIARTLPQVISLGADESRLSGAQDASANTTRTSGINLRGIGNEATLLLVNGRRVAASGVVKSLSDPNQIPAAAIQRMEVVLDGASAIYGSDAVAGVVNIITRSNTDTAETSVRYGHADGMNHKIFSQTFGKTWDEGSVFVAYEHNDRGSLSASARPFFSNDLRRYGGTDQRSTQSAPGNVLIGTTIYPIPAGQNGVNLTPAQLVAGTGNRFDAGAFGDYLPSQKRDTVYGNAFHRFNDRLEVFYEGLYSERDYNQVVAPVGSNLTVPSTSPYFVRPAGAPPATSQTVAYRFLFDDVDLNLGGTEKNTLNTVGLTYSFDNGWQANSSLTYGRTKGFVHRVGLINTRALGVAIADGSLNPFSAVAGSNPGFPGVVAYREQNAINTEAAFAVKLDGPLFTIAGGDVRLAVGTEARHVEFEQGLLQNVTTPTPTPAFSELQNSRQVKSVYSELFVPLIGSANATPWARRLELSLAARYERYSDFGSTTNPKVGVRWAVNDKFSLNTTYGTSFRAPSLVDNLGSLSSLSLTNIFVQNFTDPTAPGGVRRGILVNGGNPDLKPEEAKTWSFGLDIKPVRGWNLTASYYKINYTDRIDVVPGAVLAEEALFATYIQRNPSAATVNALYASPNLQSPPEAPGNIGVIVDGRRSNLGSLRQQGLDLDSRYTFNNAYGNWLVGFNVAKILKLERSNVPGRPFVDAVDTLGNPISLRMRANLGWKTGNWSASVFANYTGDYTNTALVPNTRVPSQTTTDLTVSYAFDKGARYGLGGVIVSANALNVFDRQPPVVINGQSAWDSQIASAVGRFVSLSLTKKW